MFIAEQAIENPVTLNTRFGVMEVDRRNAIHMPIGMIGFSEFNEYALTEASHAFLEGFLLLQCIEKEDLTFILKPYDYDSKTLRPEDLAKAIEANRIDPQHLAVMLVTTLRQTPSGIRKSVNMRAPIFIDTKKQKAWQHIFPVDDYNVRHPLH